MKCANHAKAEAIALCAECGKPLCDECAVLLGGSPGKSPTQSRWCRDCLGKIVEGRRTSRDQPGWRRSRLAAALLSVIPGAGHMYLGLIGKGFAIMGLLFASIFLVILYSDSTGMYWMTAYLIPAVSVLLLSYAVFDSLDIAEALRSGREPSDTGDRAMKMIWERVLLNPRTGGYVLLVAGIVGLLSLFDAPVSEFVRESLGIDIRITGLLVPVILVIIGVFLLNKGRGER